VRSADSVDGNARGQRRPASRIPFVTGHLQQSRPPPTPRARSGANSDDSCPQRREPRCATPLRLLDAEWTARHGGRHSWPLASPRPVTRFRKLGVSLFPTMASALAPLTSCAFSDNLRQVAGSNPVARCELCCGRDWRVDRFK
jgi:hypothetical protein